MILFKWNQQNNYVSLQLRVERFIGLHQGEWTYILMQIMIHFNLVNIDYKGPHDDFHHDDEIATIDNEKDRWLERILDNGLFVCILAWS